MRRAAALVPLTAALLFAVPAAAAEAPRLTRVLLSTGGVGYFEYRAEVSGTETLPLSVPLAQVDDVLKSLVIFDDRGSGGTVRLPGRAPLEQAFADLPFDREDLGAPAKLLNALQGAEVRIDGPQAIQGRILQVTQESVALPNGRGSAVRHRLGLLTADGIEQVVLEEAGAVRFVSGELERQIGAALEAVSRHSVRGRRTLEIEAAGAGARTVRLGYVVAAPLWKASYRLTFAGGVDAPEARLDGWAVVDNLSGRDWDGVSLSLVSGNPVTFRQALYQAYFVNRPEVPVEVMGRVLPRLDRGAAALAERPTPSERAADDGRRVTLRSLQAATVMSKTEAEAAQAAPQPTAPPPPQATAEEAATQVEFRFAKPVSVRNGESLLVPIIARAVPAERVALYQPETEQRHPLAAVRLTNDGDSGLPPGVVTLYDRAEGGRIAYLGDARLDTLPAGEERLVSFAVDQKMRIDRETRHAQRIVSGAFERGVFRLTLRDEQTTLYRVTGAPDTPRRLLIEHRRRPGWDLAAPKPESVTLAENWYRIARRIGAGETVTIPVTLSHQRLQTMQVASLDTDAMVRYATTGALGPEVRAAFARLAELQRALDGAEAALARIEDRYKTITQEQSRIRSNLGRVPRQSDLYRRYLAKLSEQETELERILSRRDGAQAAVASAKEALSTYVAGLNIP